MQAPSHPWSINVFSFIANNDFDGSEPILSNRSPKEISIHIYQAVYNSDDMRNMDFRTLFGEIYVWAGGGEIAYITKAETCFPRFIPLAVAIIGYVVPSGLMALCYFLVYRAVRKHSMTVTCSPQRGDLQSAGPSCEELRTTKILFVVMLGFILCWVPTQVIGILLGKLMKTIPPEYPTICFTLIYLSSAVNPIIYGVMNHKFRKEIKNLVLSLKDGVARMCLISLRRWFKTSTANNGQRELSVLRAICMSLLPPPCQLKKNRWSTIEKLHMAKI